MEFWQQFSPAIAGPRPRPTARRTSSCSARSTTPTRRSRRPTSRPGRLPATLDFPLPGRGARLRARARRRPEPARPLRRRRLLHRPRLQRLRAADLPRQPRHGPDRHAASRHGGATGADLLDRDRARQRADVPHPRPAGRLLRRRAGLHRRRRRQGRPPGHVRLQGRRLPRRRPDRHRPHARKDRYDTTAPAVPADRAAVGAAQGQPGARGRRADPPLRRRRRRRLRVLPRRRARPATEYLVAANNATTAKTASFATYSAEDGLHARCTARAPRCAPAGTAGVDVTVPPLSVVGVEGPLGDGRAQGRTGGLPHLARRPAVSSGGRAEIGAAIPDNAFAQVTFAYRPVGTTGVDSARHRRQRAVPACSRTSPAIAKGTLLEYRAVAKDSSGNVSADLVLRHRRRRRTRRRWRSRSGRPGHPARQRQRPGHAQLRDGLPRRLAAGLRAGAAHAGRPGPDLEGHLHDHPGRARTTTRRRSTRAGTRTTAPAGAKGGGNITYTAPGGTVTFYYDHATHYVTSDAQGPIITAPGSLPERARAAPPTGARTACARGCRTPTATAPTPGPPTRSPPAATSSRSPTACRGTRATATTATTSASRCPRTGTVVTISLRPVHPPDLA